jgi:hypothetical protein
MAGATDEFEARIGREWGQLRREMERQAARVGAKLDRDLARTFRPIEEGGARLDSRAFAALSTREQGDKDIWQWLDGEYRRLRIWPARARKGAVEVNNRYYAYDRGLPKKLAGDASADAVKALRDAARPLKVSCGAYAQRKAEAAAEEAAEKHSEGAAQSWLDNIVRALEQTAHQMSMAIVDATSGPATAGEFDTIAAKFTPNWNTLALSYLTHQRASFRAVLGEAGEALAAALGEKQSYFLYHLPAAARVAAVEEGFAARHFSLIKTRQEWTKVLKGLGAKKPGSFPMTTGFHVGDRGYLLPIPPTMLADAREIERVKRQTFLLRLAKRAKKRGAASV